MGFWVRTVENMVKSRVNRGGPVDFSFWHGKRVLITGHTGFKGSWLSLWLHDLGADVYGFALPPTAASLYAMAGVEEVVSSIFADIRELGAVHSAMEEIKPEIIIHLAAQPLVRDSYLYPIDTLATNIMGTANLLQAVRSVSGIRSLVNVTTDKVYDNKEWIWGYRENDALGGYDPYSASKACSELITSAFRHSYFQHDEQNSQRVAIATARAGNVIGGGDTAKDRLVPDCIAALQKQEPVVIRNPHSVRPWQHVLDPLSGYLMVAEKLYTHGMSYAKGWNFGPISNDARTVEWIVRYLYDQWGASEMYKISDAQHPHETNQLRLDCSQAVTELGWYPRWDLETSLDKVVDWHRAVEQGASPRNVSLRQIEEYMHTEVNSG